MAGYTWEQRMWIMQQEQLELVLIYADQIVSLQVNHGAQIRMFIGEDIIPEAAKLKLKHRKLGR